MAEPQENWFAANAPKAAPAPSIRRDARGVPISESNPAEDRPIASWVGHLVDAIRHPTPGQQLAMDALPIVTGAIGNKLTNPVQGAKNIAATVADTRAAIAPFAETVITKKLGMDPEAIQLQAARLKLAAARSQTRQGRLAAEIAKAQAPTASTAAPAAAAPVASPPSVPSGAAAPVATAAPSNVGAILKAMQAEGMSGSEVEQAYKWIKAGVDPKVAWQRIQEQRALLAQGPFSKLPTDADVASEIANRGPSNRSPQRRP